LKDLPAIVVHNPGWEAGQSTSVRAGLNTLPRPVGAAIFLLSDQPRVTPDLLQKLVETHAHSLATIVAPQVDGRPANPVLFDQMTFPDFANIRGDLGGRQLFSKYPISWVPWHDGTILLDIDTPEDYQRLLETG
jgi:molybdenum cofactor cytidylyltransferase